LALNYSKWRLRQMKWKNISGSSTTKNKIKWRRKKNFIWNRKSSRTRPKSAKPHLNLKLTKCPKRLQTEWTRNKAIWRQKKGWWFIARLRRKRSSWWRSSRCRCSSRR
jgi:hypothetical protein